MPVTCINRGPLGIEDRQHLIAALEVETFNQALLLVQGWEIGAATHNRAPKVVVGGLECVGDFRTFFLQIGDRAYGYEHASPKGQKEDWEEVLRRFLKSLLFNYGRAMNWLKRHSVYVRCDVCVRGDMHVFSVQREAALLNNIPPSGRPVSAKVTSGRGREIQLRLF